MTTAHHSNGAEGSSSSSAEGSDGDGLPVDAVFDALRHPHRRYVLYHLSDRSEDASIAELAERIVDWEAERAGGSGRISRRERMVVALYHTHLPKLDELDLVEYDRERDRVTRCEGTTGIEPYLEFAADYELVPN